MLFLEQNIREASNSSKKQKEKNQFSQSLNKAIFVLCLALDDLRQVLNAHKFSKYKCF
jgi:hypothetical protein